MSEGDSKVGVKTEDNLITIKVVSQDNNEIQFKIKRSTKMSKLMKAYCEKQGLDQNAIRFLVDGTNVTAGDTPESLEMEDGDMIDVMQQQTGGC